MCGPWVVMVLALRATVMVMEAAGLRNGEVDVLVTFIDELNRE
jgi:hypothetical protein